MQQTFTPNDLVAYLYNETTAGQMLAIREALHRDPALQSELRELRQAQRELPRVKFNAPARTLDRVRHYSRAAALEEQA